jgi:hypothetical protein
MNVRVEKTNGAISRAESGMASQARIEQSFFAP